MTTLFRSHGKGLLCALTIGVTACSTAGTPTNNGDPDPVATALVKVDGDGQSATVGAALGTSLVVQVNDQNGAAMASVSVNFSVTAGGGTVTTASASTNSSGQASTDWTLGTTAGTHTVRASVTSNAAINADFGADASADVPAALTLVGGDMQTGLVSQPLTNPIEVKVEDQFGNGVSNQPVTFSLPPGTGSLGTTDANTGADGIALTTWTLGPVTGTQTADATAAGLTGSPIPFTATATTLSLSSVTPDPLVEGATATLTGTGFDLTAGNNAVTVDGVAATVTMASTTSLTVTLPTFDCQPARDVNITVGVSGETSSPINQRLNPATTMNIAVGAQQVLATPADFCLNFLADPTGNDSYLIGVSATAELDAVMAFSLTAVAGASSSPPTLLAAPDVLSSARPQGRMLTPLEQDELEREYAYRASEMRIRQWERDNANLPMHPAIRSSDAVFAVPGVPTVGQQFTINVPDIETMPQDLCANFTPITVEVKKVGSRGIVAVDLANPVDVPAGDDPFTDADLQQFSDTFDNDIYDMLITNFDAPSDIDNNEGRIWMVLTIEVNKFAIGAAGFVSSTDLRDPATCASSNQGETFYGYVPDPRNTAAGPFDQTNSSVVGNMPALIAHEVTHTIQQSRRNQPGNVFMASWEAEGQADLAKELLGFSQRSDTPGQDYGQAKIIANGANDALYAQRFSRLGRYFGWDLGTGKVANAPHDCSLYSFKGLCTSAFFYGASWSMHRWILDQYGPSYLPGGVEQMEKDWIGKFPLLTGRANVEALVGVDFDDLFVQWAAMLYVDGRTITGLDPSLEMTSWDLFDVFSFFDASLSLVPTAQGWGAFTDANDVRGGSTFYTVVTAGGARGAMALRLRDGADGTLATTMNPRYWVVRLQ